MSKSPKISQNTVDNPEHNAYNNGVKRNRNSSGQGDTIHVNVIVDSRPTVTHL